MDDTIRANFKILRKKVNLSQEQLALFLGLEQSSISKYENGERTLSVSNLEKASSIFGIFYQDLSKNLLEVTTVVPTFRKDEGTIDSLQDIAEINKIALNIIEMNRMLGL